ncbi:PREDICTED: uncharacterized protein LOC108372841 isoform X2 [Rhagoletis zephyria]|uniref:uncharacterized protein LOC108372841 isoform X2 n=1 Tax=Rhagoletis zephyria TaxID=28612 RepID=UPI0008115654|nr:PREDICTED: uncharacterized protein LOC108372841 isoform X2 [Rhagoletis zephyria]
MTTKIKQPNTKPRQFEILVNFMMEHSDLAKGQIKGLAAKQTSNNLWKRLENELNSCGPPTHNFTEWKKIWADYKSNIKAKLRRNKESMSGTGGGPSRFCSLTATEEQVVAYR